MLREEEARVGQDADALPRLCDEPAPDVLWHCAAAWVDLDTLRLRDALGAVGVDRDEAGRLLGAAQRSNLNGHTSKSQPRRTVLDFGDRTKTSLINGFQCVIDAFTVYIYYLCFE